MSLRTHTEILQGLYCHIEYASLRVVLYFAYFLEVNHCCWCELLSVRDFGETETCSIHQDYYWGDNSETLREYQSKLN